MLKMTTLTLAIGAVLALFAVDANALPLAPTKQQVDVGSTVTLVRDNCGRDRHFSRSRGRCVSDERVFRDDCGRGRHFSRNLGHCVRDERVIEEDCGRGRHFSRSRGHCVRNDRDSNAAAAAAVGAIFNAIGNGDHHDRQPQRHRQHPGADGRND